MLIYEGLFLNLATISELITLAHKLKSCSLIESAALYSKVQEGDATMLIQGSVAWTKKIKSMDFSLR